MKFEREARRVSISVSYVCDGPERLPVLPAFWVFSRMKYGENKNLRFLNGVYDLIRKSFNKQLPIMLVNSRKHERIPPDH